MTYPYRTALVTGASSGIGREFARQLAAHGVGLVLVARRGDRLEELATELTGTHDVPVEVLVANLAHEEELASVEKRLADLERPIELLVNNAAYAKAGDFATLPVALEITKVAVNVIAPIRLTRAALPTMLALGKGGVLTVSSLVASLPMPRSATYGATKAFLTSFSESLSMELKSRGVHVTSVAAGLTRTEFHDAAGIDIEGIPDMAWMEPARVASAGLAAVAAGKVSVVPGRFNKMQVPFFRTAPRALLRKLAKWS
jgi:short-subunit dehydrogenase